MIYMARKYNIVSKNLYNVKISMAGATELEPVWLTCQRANQLSYVKTFLCKIIKQSAENLYGGSNGARTRDLWRDKPTL